MKLFNPLFLILMCASIVPVAYASAPAPSSAPGGPVDSAPEGETQPEEGTHIEGRVSGSTLLTLEKVKLGISGKTFSQVMCDEAYKQSISGVNVIVKSILGQEPSLTPSGLVDALRAEIQARLAKRQTEVEAHFADVSHADQRYLMNKYNERIASTLAKAFSTYNNARSAKYAKEYKEIRTTKGLLWGTNDASTCSKCHARWSYNSNECLKGCVAKSLHNNEKADFKKYQEEHCQVQ